MFESLKPSNSFIVKILNGKWNSTQFLEILKENKWGMAVGAMINYCGEILNPSLCRYIPLD